MSRPDRRFCGTRKGKDPNLSGLAWHLRHSCPIFWIRHWTVAVSEALELHHLATRRARRCLV